MRVQIKSGFKKFANPAAIQAMAMKDVDAKLGAIASEMASIAKQSMGKGGGKAHVPSAPGTPPHVQTGRLRASVIARRMRPGRWIVGVTGNAKYGLIHEKGGTVNVPAHEASRQRKAGKKIDRRRFSKLKRAVKKGLDVKMGRLKSSWPVKAHTAKYPARPFLKPAFQAILNKYKRR